MSRKITTLEELFVDELKDLYDAEKQLLKALPKMAKAADNENLRAGFEAHLEQTEHHVERLERVFELIGESPKAKTCEAMKGLVAEGKEWIDQDGTPALKDMGIIVVAQKVEHYEISGYGSLRTIAEILGHSEAVDLLQQTLDEEKETDEKLSEITEDLHLVSERAGNETDDS
ncbi:MAG TPA: ferritin-like domain-containing protein [Candidatus Didemnitutus sp.]|nr:ferritin-like domain-containing protein [Candidatus Didemnitutus sp.]